MKRTSRFLSLLLVFTMLVSGMPLASAAWTEGVITTEEGLINAISAAKAGDTVTLGRSIELTKELDIPTGKTFTLNLGEYKITQKADGVNAIKLSTGDVVTITGSGAITGNRQGISVQSGATLTVDLRQLASQQYKGRT